MPNSLLNKGPGNSNYQQLFWFFDRLVAHRFPDRQKTSDLLQAWRSLLAILGMADWPPYLDGFYAFELIIQNLHHVAVTAVRSFTAKYYPD